MGLTEKKIENLKDSGVTNLTTSMKRIAKQWLLPLTILLRPTSAKRAILEQPSLNGDFDRHLFGQLSPLLLLQFTHPLFHGVPRVTKFPGLHICFVPSQPSAKIFTALTLTFIFKRSYDCSSRSIDLIVPGCFRVTPPPSLRSY